VPLTLLSLVYVIWSMTRDRPVSLTKGLVWGLIVLVFGPFGLLVYILVHRRHL
jgi:thiamine transporter ThiT